jgi:outer membrane receptor for ferrienterochelin and colicins
MNNYTKTQLHALCALCFLFFSNLIFAQTGIVSGSVTDSETKEVLPTAHISIPTLNLITVTDAGGLFRLPKVPAGKYTVLIQYVGFELLKEDVEVIAGRETYINVVLKPTTYMEEVVVTGTLKEGLRTESPVAVEVYSPKFFLKNPTPHIFDALQTVNGVRPQFQCNICNTGDIHINGMEGPYTMVMIDGLPIVSGLSTVYGLMGIPNSIVERMEVVKGPASTLYGSEAVGGLINIITRNPAKAPRLFADFNGTTYGEFSGDLATAVKGKKVNGLLSLNAFNFDQIWDKNKDNFTDLTLQKRFSVFNKWSFIRPENRVADIAARYFTENRWGGELNWTPQYYGSDRVYGENIKTKRVELIGNYQLPLKEKVMFMYSYNYHDQQSAYAAKIYNANQQIGVGQLTWSKLIGTHDVLAGAAFRYTYFDDNTPITADQSDLKINKPWGIKLPGVFIQDQIEFANFSTLLAGLRYDYNSEHGHILSPRLNYKWKMTKSQTLRLSLGNGYRVVNVFSEDHAALTGARETVVEPNLKPERSWNANVNYITQFYTKSSFVDLDFSLFYTYFNNKILPDYFTDPQKIYFRNLDGYGQNYGFTFNSAWNHTNGINLRAGFTLMDVYTVIGGQRQPQLYAPNFSGTWTFSVPLEKQQMTVDLTGNITSPMQLPVVPNDFRPEKSPWFSIVNVQATKKFSDRFEVYGGIKNLLNFVPKDPILRPSDPFDRDVENPNNPNRYTFDPTYNYAPLQGIRGFLGLRYSLK